MFPPFFRAPAGVLQELAAELKDPAEAARLLAQHGDFLGAAERCLEAPNFLDRATAGQIRQLHGWLLRVGTVEAARKAVQLWETLQQQGRLSDEIAENAAAAQLTLARLLLREVVGAQLPAIELSKGPAAARGAAGSAADKLTGADKEKEKEKSKKQDRKQRKKQAKELAKERRRQKQQQAEGGSAAEAAAQEEEEEEEDDENNKAESQTAAAAAQPKSYAAAASAAAEDKPSGSQSAAASASGPQAVAAAAAGLTAPIPTACLARLQQCLDEEPDYQAQVSPKALSPARSLTVSTRWFYAVHVLPVWCSGAW